MHGLLSPDEIRDPTQAAPGPVRLEEGEVNEALALIEVMPRDRAARASALRKAGVQRSVMNPVLRRRAVGSPVPRAVVRALALVEVASATLSRMSRTVSAPVISNTRLSCGVCAATRRLVKGWRCSSRF